MNHLAIGATPMTSRNPVRPPRFRPSILALRSTARTLACGMEHAKTWNNPGMFQEKRWISHGLIFLGKSEPETMVFSINIIYIYIHIYILYTYIHIYISISIWVSCNFSHHPILWDYQTNCWDSMGISWEYHEDVRWCIQQHIIHIMGLFFFENRRVILDPWRAKFGVPHLHPIRGSLEGNRKNLGHII